MPRLIFGKNSVHANHTASLKTGILTKIHL